MPLTALTASSRRTAKAGAPGAGGHATATLAAAVLGFFVITLDATIVNVALPSIRDALGGGITGLECIAHANPRRRTRGHRLLVDLLDRRPTA